MNTTIEHVVDIDASPTTVYEMWTTPDGLCAWWATTADVDPRPGGAIRVDLDGGHVMVGEFVALEPPHRVRFTFGWEDGDPPPGSTVVDVRIDRTATGSRLTLRHHGLPLDRLEAHARGWTHFLGERLVRSSGSSEP